VKYECNFGYLEEVLLFFKELLCNLSILELCSMLTFCTWCVLLLYYDILSIWYHYNPPHWHTCSCSFNQSMTIERLDYGFIPALTFVHAC
jgi:hypothetical protein